MTVASAVAVAVADPGVATIASGPIEKFVYDKPEPNIRKQ